MPNLSRYWCRTCFSRSMKNLMSNLFKKKSLTFCRQTCLGRIASSWNGRRSVDLLGVNCVYAAYVLSFFRSFRNLSRCSLVVTSLRLFAGCCVNHLWVVSASPVSLDVPGTQ